MANVSLSPQLTPSSLPLTITEDGPVAVLSLNRPAARNSLSEELLKALLNAIQEMAASRDIHAVILRANGAVFCAGHDLKELTKHRADPDGGHVYFEKIMTLCATVMQSIMACPKPVIAAVEGTATAAGCQLVASCDLAVASEKAKFCTPGVNIGLFCSTPMVALSRNLPRKHAMEMLLLGDMISAEEALTFGLVNRVTKPQDVMTQAQTFADKIASKAPKVVGIGKKAFYDQAEMSVQDAYSYAAKTMVDNMMMADSEEGIGAFLEKRFAKWEKL